MKKVALVTGGNRGIGRAIAEELAKKGISVAITYCYHEQEANEVKKYLADNYNVSVMVYKCDISKEADVKNMVSDIQNTFGNIDILVNNAATCKDSLFMDKSIADFKRILDVNIVGSYLVSKYVGKIMYENKKGKIVNISSTNAIDTYYPESCDYDASKAGVISLTHNMAREFAPYIAVNCVCPGWVNTDMNSELTPLQRDEYNKKILLGRFANPQEIAKVVVFLTSDDASYINDSIIRVDGGKFNE